MRRYCVYVDGFNLYHRCLKDSAHRWLDLRSLFQNLSFEPGQLTQLRYFTSRVIPRQNNLDIHVRQNVYLRALSTIPELSIHFGQFKMRTAQGEELNNKNAPTGRIVKIQKFEEKGSDVNIANHMLVDGFLNKYDAAILISNDSDLAGTLDLIKEHIKKPVGLGVPGDNLTYDLKKRAAFHRKITSEVLSRSQFPASIKDAQGEFHKPRSW